MDECQKKMLEEWERLNARDKKLDTDHEKEVEKIKKQHDREESILQTQQAEFAGTDRFGHADEAARNLNANRELREQRLAKEEEEYQQKKADVAKEKQDLNQFIEDKIQPERNRMEEQHALETAKCEELRKEIPNQSDVKFEQRVGDWIKTVGPVAEKAYNEIAKQYDLPEIKVEWNAVGNAAQIGLTAIAAKTDIVWPMSPREFDEALLKGVKEVQDKEWTDLAKVQTTQLEVRNKSMEQLIEMKPEKEFYPQR